MFNDERLMKIAGGFAQSETVALFILNYFIFALFRSFIIKKWQVRRFKSVIC
jgi:hypothetical protein